MWLSLSVSCIRYSKRYKFRPKMRQNALGGRAPPERSPSSPDPWLQLGAPKGKGREEGKGRKKREDGRRGREGGGRLASHTIFRPWYKSVGL